MRIGSRCGPCDGAVVRVVDDEDAAVGEFGPTGIALVEAAHGSIDADHMVELVLVGEAVAGGPRGFKHSIAAARHRGTNVLPKAQAGDLRRDLLGTDSSSGVGVGREDVRTQIVSEREWHHADGGGRPSVLPGTTVEVRGFQLDFAVDGKPEGSAVTRRHAIGVELAGSDADALRCGSGKIHAIGKDTQLAGERNADGGCVESVVAHHDFGFANDRAFESFGRTKEIASELSSMSIAVDVESTAAQYFAGVIVDVDAADLERALVRRVVDPGPEAGVTHLRMGCQHDAAVGKKVSANATDDLDWQILSL